MTTTNTKIDLDAIEARVKAATPGPWVDGHGWYNGPLFDVVSASGRTICGCSTCDRGDGVGEDENNAAFIMHARTDIPDLIAEVRRLRALVERVAVCSYATATEMSAAIDACREAARGWANE